MITRRRIVIAIGAGALTAPLASFAQQPPGKVPRVGILTGAYGFESPRWMPFRDALRELGYVEGRTIAIEARSSGGKAERFPDLAAELVGLKVDVIVATDNPAIAAARGATSTIPIVMVLSMDPVATGFVGSLARPGGNVTGLTVLGTELQGKSLQLLKEAVPSATRVAVLWVPAEPGRQIQAKEAEVAARALGLQVRLVEMRSPDEIDSLFTAMARDRLHAVLVHPSQLTFAHRVRIAEAATRNRLPTMGIIRWLPEAGGLMSYGGRDSDRFRRAAYFADKILKGARPADLPVEQPTKFELVINMKTAKALGIKIPNSILVRAEKVIE